MNKWLKIIVLAGLLPLSVMAQADDQSNDYKQTIEVHGAVARDSDTPSPGMGWMLNTICFNTTDFFDTGHCVNSIGGQANDYDHGPKNWKLYTQSIKRSHVKFAGKCAQHFTSTSRTPEQNGRLDIYVTAHYNKQTEIVTYSRCDTKWTPN